MASTSAITAANASSRSAAVDRDADPPSFPSHDDLSLQWLFSASDMPFTPSVSLSGLSTEQERSQRWKGIHFLCRIAEYARLGNHVIATSAYFFHRFYMRRPLPPSTSVLPSTLPRNFESWAQQEMAPTCLWLACKVEESHRKLHSIVEATMAVNDRTPEGMQAAEQGRYRADPNSKEYSRWKDLILLNEERLLETLCFDLIIDQPHPLAVKACKRLDVDVDLTRLTVVYLNSLLYGAVCTFFDAPILAVCAFRVACKMTDTDPGLFVARSTASSRPGGRASNGAGPSKEVRQGWLEVFDVSEEELEEALPVVQEFLDYHMEHLTSRAYPKADPRLHGGGGGGAHAQNGSGGASGGVTPHHSGGETPRSSHALAAAGGHGHLAASSSSTPYMPPSAGVSQGFSSVPRLPSSTPPPLPPPPPLRMHRDATDAARPPSRHGTNRHGLMAPGQDQGPGAGQAQGQGQGAQHKRAWEQGPGNVGAAQAEGRGSWADSLVARHGQVNAAMDSSPVRSPRLSPGAAALSGAGGDGTRGGGGGGGGNGSGSGWSKAQEATKSSAAYVELGSSSLTRESSPPESGEA